MAADAKARTQPVPREGAGAAKKKPKIKSLYIKLGLILAVGIFLMLLGGNGALPSSGEATETLPAVEPAAYRSTEEALENKIAAALGQIKGAGAVTVALTFAEGASYEYAYNEQETENTTREGGGESGFKESRQTNSSKDLVVEQEPVLLQENLPKIQGLLIVAQGGGDAAVKRQLFVAAAGLLNLPAHRIVVVEGN